MSKNKGKVVACLDIGTHKIVCIIASVSGEGITILGYSHKESQGITASAVADMRLAQKSIINVVGAAEKMAGLNIDKVVVGISNLQVISKKQEVSSRIAAEMVKEADVNNLVNAIRYQYKKNNREIIHLIPLEYRMDDNIVQNPVYMVGEKLTARFHIVSTSFTTVRNLENCLKKCQLSVTNYISESYASALASLTANEMSSGTLLIDVGATSTSFAVLSENKLVHSGSVALGGVHITRDIATILNIDFESAEKIKNLNNSLLITPLEEKEFIKLRIVNASDGVNLIKVNKGEVRDIIKSRLVEIIEVVKTLIFKNKPHNYLIAQIVISGGAAAIIGAEKLVSSVFERHARIGYPQKIRGLPSELDSPSFCSAVGILVFLHNIYSREQNKYDSQNSWFKKITHFLTS